MLCIPIAYGENFLGVLNVESQQGGRLRASGRLILNTLADLLATALHNAFVFQKLQQQSITDGLTRIKTRRFFFEALSSELKRASRSGRPISVVLMDLDKFKHVNDTKGHLEGDLVLTRVGRLLEQKCRQSNVVARYGGDEFIILMPETGVEQALILAERLRLWLSQDPMLAEHNITGSFGVASFPVHGFSMEDIVRVADAGMYKSKHAGGDHVSTAEELSGGESAAVRRQMISGYIEGFLQREHTGPEHVEELITTLKKMCGDETHTDQIFREAIETLTSAAESRELNSAGHGEMVARYSEIIARSLGLSPEDIGDLVFAARVHDVGKLFVPERILNKPGPLTEGEFYVLKMHAEVSGEILATLPEGKSCGKQCSTITNPSTVEAIRVACGERRFPLGAHYRHRRRLRKHDQRTLVCGRQDQRTGTRRTGEVERHALRRNAGTHSDSRTQSGESQQLGKLKGSVTSLVVGHWCRSLVLGVGRWQTAPHTFFYVRGRFSGARARALAPTSTPSELAPLANSRLPRETISHVYPSLSLWQGCPDHRRLARHRCGCSPHVCRRGGASPL